MGEIKLIIQPDAEENEAAEVFVDGKMGSHTYRFLLDTGAARSSIRLDDYTSTFASLGKNSSSGVFTSMSDDLITVPRIQVGPIFRQNFTLTRAAGSGSRNLIGMDLLKDFCCHFFFDEHRVSVDADDAPEVAYRFEPLLLDQKFHPYVEVLFGTIQAKAVWDTGASITVVDINLINRLPDFFEEVGYSTGTDAAGTQVETPMFIMSGAVIGSHPFLPHKVAAVDLSPVNSTLEVPMDLILGYNTLSQANWLFDFPRQRWTISKWLKTL